MAPKGTSCASISSARCRVPRPRPCLSSLFTFHFSFFTPSWGGRIGRMETPLYILPILPIFPRGVERRRKRETGLLLAAIYPRTVIASQ